MIEVITLIEGAGIMGLLLYIATKMAVVNNHSGLILEALGRIERKGK